MKTYNLSKIMKNAWEAYKNYSYGRTFGECLKDSWTMEKKIRRILNKDARPAKKAVKTLKPTIKEDYYASRGINLSWDDCYNRNSKGSMGSQYCGD